VGIHSFTSAFPPHGRGRRVQTVHELPWRHAAKENADVPHRIWSRLGPLLADRVVCPTELVADDLRRGLPARARARVRVVPWGVGAPFQEHAPVEGAERSLLEHHGIDARPYVLCPGAVRAKKNLAAVLRGLAELRRRGTELRLVVSGAETPQLRRDLDLADRLGLAGSVASLGEVQDADLPVLARRASVLAVLSHSEGFALPVAEAMACATPVVVSERSAQAEVAGEAGIRVHPERPESVADGLERALRDAAELRPLLLRRAAELSWDACAAKVEALWEELA
jgi:alpha-1,3-rhamnosyl/mannosyltransferase